MSASRRWLSFALALSGPMLVLVVWEALSRAEVINPLFFPAPTSLEGTTRELLESGALWDDLRASLARLSRASSWRLCQASCLAC